MADTISQVMSAGTSFGDAVGAASGAAGGAGAAAGAAGAAPSLPSGSGGLTAGGIGQAAARSAGVPSGPSEQIGAILSDFTDILGGVGAIQQAGATAQRFRNQEKVTLLQGAAEALQRERALNESLAATLATSGALGATVSSAVPAAMQAANDRSLNRRATLRTSRFLSLAPRRAAKDEKLRGLEAQVGLGIKSAETATKIVRLLA